MKLELFAIGKEKSSLYAPLVSLYVQRITRWPLAVTPFEVSAPEAQIQDRSDTKLLSLSKDCDYHVLLDEKGAQYTSTQFASFLQRLENERHKKVGFLIGGATGHGQNIKREIHAHLSFGLATWPHQLVRIMILEQIYRAQQILAQHPYHK